MKLNFSFKWFCLEAELQFLGIEYARVVHEKRIARTPRNCIYQGRTIRPGKIHPNVFEKKPNLRGANLGELSVGE